MQMLCQQLVSVVADIAEACADQCLAGGIGSSCFDFSVY
jgi:hypothetical protein